MPFNRMLQVSKAGVHNFTPVSPSQKCWRSKQLSYATPNFPRLQQTGPHCHRRPEEPVCLPGSKSPSRDRSNAAAGGTVIYPAGPAGPAGLQAVEPPPVFGMPGVGVGSAPPPPPPSPPSPPFLPPPPPLSMMMMTMDNHGDMAAALPPPPPLVHTPVRASLPRCLRGQFF